MSDLYAVEIARRRGRRFTLVTADVYQRGAGARADDICHLRAHHVVVPRGVAPEVVDALIAASLLQLQAQAQGEVASLLDSRSAPPPEAPPPERAGKVVGVTAPTALRIADADAAFAAHFTDSAREQVAHIQAEREAKSEETVR